MHRAHKHTVAAVMAFCFSVMPVGLSYAQSANDIVGSYTLVSAVMELDGKKSDTYGPNAKGALTLDEKGRFVLIFMRASLPKFASDNRMTGTPDENQAIVRGSFASFGNYSTDTVDKTITFHIESATFPNWNDQKQKRSFTFNGDELKYMVAAASGGGIATVTWKRAR